MKMEVRIRNVDPAIVSVIDEYAKENNETRSDYVRRLLEYESKRKILEQANRMEEEKIKPVFLAMEAMMNSIKEMSLEIQKMIALITYIADMDYHEVEYFLQNVVIEQENEA